MKRELLTHISLFTGIGGIDIAVEWAGFETVCFVEKDDYCQKVLKKHWPDVPIIGDIRDVTREKLQEVMANPAYGTMSSRRNCFASDIEASREGETDRIGWGSVNGRSRNRKKPTASTITPITLITGGFPCQPVSHAGKRKGKDDDRWLWPEMLRVISEIRPTWVVAENVAGLLNMGFNDCVSDLESAGYETTSFLIPACAVNAPHRRDRVFIVAYSKRSNQQRERLNRQGQGESGSCGSERGKDVADTNTERPQGHGGLRECRGQLFTGQGSESFKGNWESEPELGRVAHGIRNRVDRLRCLGNAVVPQQIYPVLKAIADIEKG